MFIGQRRVERRRNETSRRHLGAIEQRTVITELHRGIQHDLNIFSIFLCNCSTVKLNITLRQIYTESSAQGIIEPQ